MRRKKIIFITSLFGVLLASCSININKGNSGSTNSSSKVSSEASSISSKDSSSTTIISQSTSESTSESSGSSSQSTSESTKESSSSSSQSTSESTKESSSSSSQSTSESTSESTSSTSTSSQNSSSSSSSQSSSSSSSSETTSSSATTDLIVSYIIDDVIYKTVKVKSGETFTLESPEKEHYTFDGWYIDEARTTKYKGGALTSSINLYGHYEIEKFTVTYYSGSNVFTTDTFSYNSTIIKTTKVPTNEGYSFLGWSEDRDSTELFDFATQISSNIVLYAVFEKDGLSLNCEGYNEGLYATFSGTSKDNFKVFVANYKESDMSFEEVNNNLIRLIGADTIRVDVLGLSKGDYVLKVVSSIDNKTVYSNKISVSNYDRSGYAHFSYALDATSIDVSNGIGAYTNDGVLKSGAVVVYVTDETKNTVTATIGGKTYTGLSAILQAQSNSSVPLDIRLIGSINAATWNTIDYKTSSTTTITPSDVIGANGIALELKNYTESELISGGYNTLETTYTKLNGLTNKIKYDSSKGEFDSYYNMLDISSAKNVTVEGVGEDATIFGWGFTWKNCSSIEVRNITFDSYTEDACSFEGSDDSKTLSGFKSGHIWIHNNTFNEGKNNWDVCNEQDKHEGDGATDFKKNAFITLSYNHYYKNHKTGLVGGSDSQHTACITFHHNFYDTCQSRLPLARQANMHMYNNYYYNSTSYSISVRANGYAFVENCYFEGGQNPYELQTSSSNGNGYIKVYGSQFVNVKISNTKYSQGNTVTSRDEAVNNTNLYGTDFDTNSEIFYYSSGSSNVENLTSALKAKEDCLKYAGVLKSSSN